jgi:hypothetical protein
MHGEYDATELCGHLSFTWPNNQQLQNGKECMKLPAFDG